MTFDPQEFSDSSAPPSRAWLRIALVVAGVVVAVMATTNFHGGVGQLEKARRRTAEVQVEQIAAALAEYYAARRTYPPTSHGLTALADDTSGKALLRPIPDDPWGHGFVYQYPGQHNIHAFDLSSMGPDGFAGTRDDVTNWEIVR